MDRLVAAACLLLSVMLNACVPSLPPSDTGIHYSGGVMMDENGTVHSYMAPSGQRADLPDPAQFDYQMVTHVSAHHAQITLYSEASLRARLAPLVAWLDKALLSIVASPFLPANMPLDLHIYLTQQPQYLHLGHARSSNPFAQDMYLFFASPADHDATTDFAEFMGGAYLELTHETGHLVDIFRRGPYMFKSANVIDAEYVAEQFFLCTMTAEPAFGVISFTSPDRHRSRADVNRELLASANPYSPWEFERTPYSDTGRELARYDLATVLGGNQFDSARPAEQQARDRWCAPLARPTARQQQVQYFGVNLE